MAKYYITTTAPYVNSDPHIGFALEIIQADVLARYHELIGDTVFFNTGTDEHGKKIWDKAQEEKVEIGEYVDKFAHKFRNLKDLLCLSENLHFSRTTDEQHIKAAQEMWRRVEQAGYIRKGIYRAKYCVGCELEKQDSELVDGKCPIHPTGNIEIIEEENYFFEFSKLAKRLLEHYKRHSDFVVPSNRQKEITKFVENGLADFSISRLAAKMPWGVPVPGDPSHVMYVWFDALTYYISALGWPDESKSSNFAKFWGEIENPQAIQVAGKDNLRQQSSMWQAMLMAAGLPPSRQIMIHGFITSGGVKMSKSLGNVVNPLDYVNRYGIDPLRYYLLAKMDPFEDSDFTQEKFEEVYQSDLANGLGNLVSRVAAMCANLVLARQTEKPQISKQVSKKIEKYRFDEALADIWQRISEADREISSKRVWELEGNEKIMVLDKLVGDIRQVAYDLQLFMPKTAMAIYKHFDEQKIEKMKPIFPRLS